MSLKGIILQSFDKGYKPVMNASRSDVFEVINRNRNKPRNEMNMESLMEDINSKSTSFFKSVCTDFVPSNDVSKMSFA